MAETEVLTGKRGRKAAVKAAQEGQEPTKPKGKKASTDAGPTFWDKQDAINKADWGPRANVYLYRVEPMIDRTRSGNLTYITKYAEAISEDRVLADHGSGKYKAMLNFRKPGADKGDEIDSIYFELLNLQYPPKVPPGEWVDDPRNKKWAWAKQHYEKQAGNGGGGSTNLVEALDVLNEIQDSTTKRVLAQLPQQRSAADDFVKFASVLDTVRPPAPPPPPPDNTLPAFMQAELASIRAQVEKSREREIALMEKLIEAKTTKSNDGGTGLGLVKELVGGLKDLLPSVKELFPGLGDAGGGSRSRLGPWQELAVAVTPHVAQVVSPFSNVFAQMLMMKMAGGNGMAGMPPQPHGQPPASNPALPAAAGAPATMMPFLQMIAFPMVTHIRFMGPPENAPPSEIGNEFANWVFNGFGSDARYEQAILAARSMGPLGIITAFRSTPLWTDKGPQGNLSSLAELEGKLTEFFTAFLNWTQETEETEEPEGVTPEVLTYQEG